MFSKRRNKTRLSANSLWHLFSHKTSINGDAVLRRRFCSVQSLDVSGSVWVKIQHRVNFTREANTVLFLTSNQIVINNTNLRSKQQKIVDLLKNHYRHVLSSAGQTLLTYPINGTYQWRKINKKKELLRKNEDAKMK